MGIVQPPGESLDFWADAAVALGTSLPRKARVALKGDMGYGLQATAPI